MSVCLCLHQLHGALSIFTQFSFHFILQPSGHHISSPAAPLLPLFHLLGVAPKGTCDHQPGFHSYMKQMEPLVKLML